MSEILAKIRVPIAQEMSEFNDIFRASLSHTDGLLAEVLHRILQHEGKQMRPLLTLLSAKAIRPDADCHSTNIAASSLELLHTASLVHDDVVDESNQRRGQQSVNAAYDNKVAVLVGDYILSTALKQMACLADQRMTTVLSVLGQTLSSGEVEQLQAVSDMTFSETTYYNVIRKKTAALFEACCHLGALSVGASADEIARIREFGQNLGIVFQIRDDIFDYFDSKEIGKPTGNDMREGKLTLPVLYCLNNGAPAEVCDIARRVKSLKASDDDIATLIAYTKAHGGIEYAQQVMDDYYQQAVAYINNNVACQPIADALQLYAAYVVGRDI